MQLVTEYRIHLIIFMALVRLFVCLLVCLFVSNGHIAWFVQLYSRCPSVNMHALQIYQIILPLNLREKERAIRDWCALTLYVINIQLTDKMRMKRFRNAYGRSFAMIGFIDFLQCLHWILFFFAFRCHCPFFKYLEFNWSQLLRCISILFFSFVF